MRCPPHGPVARYATLALLPLLLWGVAHSVFGPIGAAPSGTLFLLLAMVVCALLLGRLFELARLPALLGMLLTGIALKNLPGIEFEDRWPDYSSTLRGTALVIILMRAGLGLDPQALIKHSGNELHLRICVRFTLTLGGSYPQGWSSAWPSPPV